MNGQITFFCSSSWTVSANSVRALRICAAATLVEALSNALHGSVSVILIMAIWKEVEEYEIVSRSGTAVGWGKIFRSVEAQSRGPTIERIAVAGRQFASKPTQLEN